MCREPGVCAFFVYWHGWVAALSFCGTSFVSALRKSLDAWPLTFLIQVIRHSKNGPFVSSNMTPHSKNGYFVGSKYDPSLKKSSICWLEMASRSKNDACIGSKYDVSLDKNDVFIERYTCPAMSSWYQARQKWRFCRKVYVSRGIRKACVFVIEDTRASAVEIFTYPFFSEGSYCGPTTALSERSYFEPRKGPFWARDHMLSRKKDNFLIKGSYLESTKGSYFERRDHILR